MSSSANPQVLTGIRKKVLEDRYLLKNPSDGSLLETSIEQLWQRVSSGISSIEATSELRDEWREKFYKVLEDFKFVPAGRILAGAGTGHEVTYMNCFAAETLVHTKQGLREIGTLRGTQEVLSDGGVWRDAEFKSFGIQKLMRVELENHEVLYATEGLSLIHI